MIRRWLRSSSSSTSIVQEHRRASLHTPRSDAAVGFLTSKRAIVVAGGYSDRVSDMARGSAIANIEVLQLANDVSATTVSCSDASMIEPRAGAAIATVPRGFVVIGGVGSPGQASATAETLTFDAGRVGQPSIRRRAVCSRVAMALP